MRPTVLLVNPWIHDFAAYDLWAKPLGLLYLAAFLRSSGCTVRLIDCLDVDHPELRLTPNLIPPKRNAFGTGKFWKQRLPKPAPLAHVRRDYYRYGITREIFTRELKKGEEPRAVLVTSLMTYWYPGVVEAVAIIKEVFPRVPVILGGIYARLCSEHALSYSGADVVFPGDLDEDKQEILTALDEAGITAGKAPPDPLPYPAFDLLPGLKYICLMTSRGCPYHCRYCASRFLNPVFVQREPMEVVEEIVYWRRNYGIEDFAFYDDALLVDHRSHLLPMLEKLIDLDLGPRFHTPNAVHIREIRPDLARLLRRAGFRTIRLGLESSDVALHRDLDGKVAPGEFEAAAEVLKSAGFSRKEIGAYILMGLPGQSVASVEETIRSVGRSGVMPFLAEYSPLPHTALWEEAVSCSEYDLKSEPLFHNNSLLPCWNEEKRRELPRLRRMVRELRAG